MVAVEWWVCGAWCMVRGVWCVVRGTRCVIRRAGRVLGDVGWVDGCLVGMCTGQSRDGGLKREVCKLVVAR